MNIGAPLETLVKHVADDPVTLARFAQLLLAKGHGDRAREFSARAIALAPNDAEVQALVADVLSHGLPGYYFSLVRDHVRNAAYDAALRRAIKPGCHVLEIGTGTGLFAMMAARAGAEQVITCECNPAVAAVATEVIARNGLADRVRVIPKYASDLEIGVDLARPADVLVTELVSNDVVSLNILQIVEQSARRLLRNGAAIIPARGHVRIALAEDREIQRKRMGVVDHFDLSSFNRLAASRYHIRVGDSRLVLRSAPRDLFQFDFQSGGPFPEAKISSLLTASGGYVNGIAQWFCLEMDREGRYEDAPSVGTAAAWDVLFYPLMRPLEMKSGDEIEVFGSHDHETLRVWVNSP